MRFLPQRAPERTLPRVSVIILSHNDGLTIEQTLCSVIDQGYEHVERIAVDAGSEDETLAIIQHYDDDLAHWHSRSGLTPGEMINHALRVATGSIVCVVRAGDLLLPGALEEAAREMGVGGGPRWLVGHAQRIGANDEHLGASVATSAVAFEEFLTHDAGCLPLETSFFRREVLMEAGGFDAALTHGYGYEMTCRLLSMDIRPRIMKHHVAATRSGRDTSAEAMLSLGEEQLVVAERYAGSEAVLRPHLLTTNLTERRRIYDAALAESRESDARRFFWARMLRRPEWLAIAKYRQALLNSTLQPAVEPAAQPLRAAA